MISVVSPLPAGYQEVEYIENSGFAFIDTNYVPNQDTRIELLAMPLNVVDAGNGTGFIPYGAAEAYNINAFECYSQSGKLEFNYGSSYGFSNVPAMANEKYYIVHNKDIVTLAESQTAAVVDTVNLAANTFNGFGSLTLFGTNRETFLYSGAMRLYYCAIYENDELVSEFIPCKDADGDVGLYDISLGGFFVNGSSDGGRFFAGQDSNLHSSISMTAAGDIPMQWALRRRMMIAAQGGVDVAALNIAYTGTYQDYGVVQMTDGEYRLLAFTSSGTLTIDEPVACEVCVVGGGANGGYDSSHGSPGGAGAYLKNQIINDFVGGEVIVGAAQGVSSIGSVSVNAVSGKDGGTGGGAGGALQYRYSGSTGTSYGQATQYPGTGDGLSKYPFGDSSYSLWVNKPHCAGGAGGPERRYNEFSETYSNQAGGNGGSNGSNGFAGAWDTYSGGTGGLYGGANGGTLNSGNNATYYGSGGGGLGYRHVSEGRTAGAGYQGIVYLRISVNQ